MYPIGLAVLHSSLLSKENFSALKNAGIDAAEISIAHTDIPYSELDFDKIRRDADLAGLHLWSVHCQFTGVDALSSCDTELNKRWLERNKDVVNRVAAAGIDKMVMHTCDCANDDRAGSIEHAMYYLNELVEYAHPKGFSIAAENLPRDCLGNTPEELIYKSGYSVAMCALDAFEAGVHTTDAELVPTYLRMPQAERERLERLSHS